MAFNPFSAFGFGSGGAYDAQRATLAGLQSNINIPYNEARQALLSGQTGGIGALQAAAPQAAGYLEGYLQPSVAALQSGVGAYDVPGGTANQYAGYTSEAADAAANAMGLRGQQGYDEAVRQFQAGPGFKFALDRAIEAATRGATATGQGNVGGNLLDELLKTGTQYGNQAWQQNIANLQTRQGLYAPLAIQGQLGVAGGRARGFGDIASQYGGTGRSLADIALRTGGGVADIYGRTGQNLADVFRSQAGAIGNIGQTIAGTYPAEYQTEAEGANNFWKAVGGGAQFAAGGGLFGKPFGPYAPKA